jgi:hypothetical protein
VFGAASGHKLGQVSANTDSQTGGRRRARRRRGKRKGKGTGGSHSSEEEEREQEAGNAERGGRTGSAGERLGEGDAPISFGAKAIRDRADEGIGVRPTRTKESAAAWD